MPWVLMLWNLLIDGDSRDSLVVKPRLAFMSPERQCAGLQTGLQTGLVESWKGIEETPYAFGPRCVENAPTSSSRVCAFEVF